MGYNISKHSIIRNKPQLDEMLLRRKTFEITTAKPRRLAQKLWEAIRSAVALSERHPEFEKYAELEHLYQIQQMKTGVRCTWIASDPVEPSQDSSKAPPSAPTRMEYPEASSLLDVIAAAMKFESAPEIRFENARLSENEKKTLYEWTQKADVKWSFVDHDDGGLTLTTREVPSEILWRPEPDDTT